MGREVGFRFNERNRLSDYLKNTDSMLQSKMKQDIKSCHREVFMAIPVFRCLLLSGLLLISSLAGAKTVSSDGTTAPDAAAPAAFQLQYLSVFTHYQSFREQPLLSWQETNDNAGKIGGWRFYARDAQQPDNGASAAGARPDSEEKQPSGPIENTEQHSGHGRKP